MSLSVRKKLFFSGVLLLGLVMLLELAFRVWELRESQRVTVENQFITATNVVRVFEKDVEKDGKRVYVRTAHHWIPRWPRFAAEKGDNTFRVFCLGGSAAMGWPHSGDQSYPAFLKKKLELLYPDKTIEVLNVAGNTYASYRVKIVFDEIVQYDPDLVVIYSGNNEFLENVVYRDQGVSGTRPKNELSRPLKFTALGRFAQQAMTTESPSKRVVDIQNYGIRDQMSNRLSFAFGRASELRRDPEQFEMVRDHYRFNLESIVKRGREFDLVVALVKVPVNIKDWVPNVSVHRDDLSDNDRERFKSALRDGTLASEDGHFKEAVTHFRRATEIDSEYAEAWYLLGDALRKAGRLAEARDALGEALDRDAYPFRALFNDDLVQIAAEHGAPLVDAVAALERQAADALIGLDVMVDYVHPTVASNEVIAHELLLNLARRDLLPSAPAVNLDDARIPIPPGAGREINALRGLFGQFLIMRQYDQLEEIATRLREAIKRERRSADDEVRARLDDLRNRVDRAMEVIGPYRRLLRAEKLGTLDEEFSPEEAEAAFEAYVELIRETEGKRVSSSEFEPFVPERSYAE